MQKLESFIRDFCKSNTGKDSIDFSIFKNPENLSHQLGFVFPLNHFKGLIFERLLEELFLGNGYFVERLGEGGKDGGCDLLVKYPDNSVRFVLQAKNWNKHIDLYDVRKEHLKFTDNHLPKHNLNNTHFCFVAWGYVGRIKSQLLNKINIKVWDEQDLIDNLFKKYQPSHPKYPTIVLEPYQESAFDKILEYWNNNKRCYVEHCTGTGKTYIIAKLTQYLLEDPSNRILILSPSNYINDRIIRLLETVTSRKYISSEFSRTNRINLLTYQYLMHNAEKRSLKGSFSHIIMDEVHRAGAPEWHTRGLLNAIDDGTKLVGLSATMQRYSGGFDVKGFLDNKSAGTLTLFQAMARGILPVGEYVYSVLDMQSKVQELTEEIESKYDKAPSKKERLLEKLNAREIKDYSIQNIIYKYYHELKYRKMIAFCEDIEHTIDIGALLEKTFMEFCKVKQFKVHSENTKATNNEQLQQFSDTVPAKKEIFILNAVDMLNEGIDVPGIDSVMLFRRTESPRIYLQQIGRSIRRHGKESPLIFDCVLNYQNVKIPFISEAKREFDNYRKALEEFDFKNIDVPKNIHVYDEIESISKIIEEVERRLNFYPTYEEAREAIKRLNIKSQGEYKKRYKDDPRFPSHPDGFYSDKGWIDWFHFFSKSSPDDYYPTHEEAKQAVAKINIKSQSEYNKRYNEDLKLPSNPQKFYKDKGWINWLDFLGKPTPDFYPTYEEAKRAVQKLNIKSNPEYNKRYKEDLRLPSAPSKFYKNIGWIGWSAMFDKSLPDYYPTYDEARRAVQRLNIRTNIEYRKRYRYKEDPRLPAAPDKFYKNMGWIDWFDFLGNPIPDFYPTHEEARRAVRKLNILGRGEYQKQKRYKEDPMLPVAPDKFYSDKGWIDRFDFLGKRRNRAQIK